MDQVVADLRPLDPDRLVADVMAHAGGARREDRDVGAAFLLQADLVLLQALADLVVRHLQAGARRQRGLALDRLGLVLAEAVQVLGLGRVVAVAVDDHGGPSVDGGKRRGGYGARDECQTGHVPTSLSRRAAF